MVEWVRCSAQDTTPAAWDQLLGQATDANPFQSYAWGEYKRRSGWEPERWQAIDEHRQPLGCLQVLKKQLLFNRFLVWTPGGPVIGFPNCHGQMSGALVSEWLESFRRHHRLVYARFSSHHRVCAEAAAGLTRVCGRPSVPVTSGYTIQLDLTRSLDELRSAMTRKHRYYVKQSQAAGLTWTMGRSSALLDDFAHLYAQMSRVKQARLPAVELGSLQALADQFQSNCLVLIGYQARVPVTACLTLRIGDKVFYMTAATGTQGRRVSAAYAMISTLFDVLKQRGASRLDFGGISPDQPSAAGVNHFKQGFGGERIQYLGEWEWALTKAVSWGANQAMRRWLR